MTYPILYRTRRTILGCKQEETEGGETGIGVGRTNDDDLGADFQICGFGLASVFGGGRKLKSFGFFLGSLDSKRSG